MSTKFNLNTLSNKKSFDQPTPGVQEARILRVIDLGIRKPHPKFPNTKPKQQLLLMFELADDKTTFNDKEVPLTVFYRVNIAGKKQSGEHSKFTGLVAAAGLGDEFELNDFLGKAVSLTLTKEQNGDRVFVTGVAGLSERVAAGVPELQGDSFAFDFAEPNEEILINKLSDNMRTQLTEAVNFSGSKVEKILNGGGNNENAVEDVGM
jgi:hypothetical protein